MAGAAKKAVDWAALEPHYRAGVRSLKEIGEEFGCSDVAIIKHAKKHGWTRDLTAKIKAKADAKVSAAAVSAEVREQRAANEQAVVEANAEVQYRVRMEHRQDIQRSRRLFQTLLGELEDLGTHGDLARQLFEVVNAPETDDEKVSAASRDRIQRMRQQLEAVLSTPGRIDSGKKVVEMLEKLVRMEREAFGIDTGASDTAGSISITF